MVLPEVWLTNPAFENSVVLLFADGNPGWYPFTRELAVSGPFPGINAVAQWSDAVGNWTAKGGLWGSGYPGPGFATIDGDGSGSVHVGRFEVVRLQLSSFQDGIAVGSLTVVRDNVDPSTQAITSVTDFESAPCAFMVLNDGSAILTSAIYGENWPFTRWP